MNSNEEVNISELCRIIRDSVGSAVGKAAVSPEMQEIKDVVRSVVREVTSEVSSGLRGADETVRREVRRQVQPKPYVYNTPKAAPPIPEVAGPPVWKGNVQSLRIKGNLLSILGTVGTVVSVGLCVGVGVVAARFMTNVLAWGVFSLIPLGAVAAFAMMTNRGFALHGMAGRYKQYLATIGNERFCPIKLLSEAVHKSVRFVQRDLRRMIRAGMFPEGQLDKGKTTLILDMETYRHYLIAQQKMLEDKKAKPAESAESATETEVQIALREGREYIRRMRLANDLISGEEMSRKIDRIEQVGVRIFEHVEQHPDKLPDIRRLMSYYLPITLKLLESYAKFESQPVQGDNIKSAKREIEETLDTVVVAFENLLDSLFQREAMDLSSDISALEAMLAQEGLTPSDFKSEQK